MWAATYLTNFAPHSALTWQPRTRTHFGREADLSRLRNIGAGAFVLIETHTKKLDDQAGEGKQCGYSQDTKAYRIFNPATREVVEKREFRGTPSQRVPPPGDYN